MLTKTMCHVVIGLFGLSVVSGAQAVDTPFDWQRDYACVTETGNIVWTPQAFRFVAGDSLRYIDFESGSDANDGTSKETPWKHHPWDVAATGKAAAATGWDTAVFKGGVRR